MCITTTRSVNIYQIHEKRAVGVRAQSTLSNFKDRRGCKGLRVLRNLLFEPFLLCHCECQILFQVRHHKKPSAETAHALTWEGHRKALDSITNMRSMINGQSAFQFCLTVTLFSIPAHKHALLRTSPYPSYY